MKHTLIIESPYAGDVERNLDFARNMCKVAVKQGYAPFASHLFYTQFLDDNKPKHRKHGIECGFSWGRYAMEIWFCVRDLKEFSDGMRKGLDFYMDRELRPFMFLVEADQNGTIRRMRCLNLQSHRALRNSLMGTSSIPSDSVSKDSNL